MKGLKQSILLVTIWMFMLLGLSAQEYKPFTSTEPLYKEHYRNQYHFSVSRGWISDPCGYLYYEGKYHCYWWGCAESEDLVYFNEINRRSQVGVPRKLGCWTGCVVADVNNTAGFGAGKYISCLTHNDDSLKIQTQGLGISDDHGQTFQYYDGNPVLDIGYQDFRDPTVIWYEPTQEWIMVVSKTLESKAAFYASKDLKEWRWLSDFGPAGRTYRCFECPDLFKLPVEPLDPSEAFNPLEPKCKWVLVVSVDWDNEQYFVGEFDGVTFKAEGLQDETGVYVDCAPDFYASRTFKDFDGTLNGEVYSMGWMSNWAYCRLLPQTYGKGFWSIPRRLSLKQTAKGWRLVQQPKQDLTKLRGKKIDFSGTTKPGLQILKGIESFANTYEMVAEFDCTRPNTFGLNLCAGEGRKLVLTYDTESHSLVVDRTQVADFQMDKFERTCHSTVEPIDGKLRLRIFVDKCAVEIFSEDGTSVFSLATFAADSHTEAQLFSLNKGTKYQMQVWQMNSIWDK